MLLCVHAVRALAVQQQVWVRMLLWQQSSGGRRGRRRGGAGNCGLLVALALQRRSGKAAGAVRVAQCRLLLLLFLRRRRLSGTWIGSGTSSRTCSGGSSRRGRSSSGGIGGDESSRSRGVNESSGRALGCYSSFTNNSK